MARVRGQRRQVGAVAAGPSDGGQWHPATTDGGWGATLAAAPEVVQGRWPEEEATHPTTGWGGVAVAPGARCGGGLQ
jgi:hypothetical protein